MRQGMARMRVQTLNGPPGVRPLFTHPYASVVWFVVRLYIGWQWLDSGRHKLFGAASVGWVRDGVVGGKPVHAGDRLLGFWRHAIAPPAPGSMPQVGFAWYRDFLRFLIDHHTQTWFAPLIAVSEFAVGVLLLLGAFTAVAAATGALLNFNYMLAGSASINPVLFLGALLLIAAWRVAGYIGLDRWLLPALGMPWHPGWLFRRSRRPAPNGASDWHARIGTPPRPQHGGAHGVTRYTRSEGE